MLDVTQQIVIESHRDGCSSLSRYCAAGPVLEQNFIQRDEVIDLAERLQMRSEHVDRHAGDNLAACRGKGSHAMVDQNKTVAADSGERAHGPVYRGRPQQRRGYAPCQLRHRLLRSSSRFVANALIQRSASAIQSESWSRNPNSRSLPTAGCTRATAARPAERRSPPATASA